MKLQIKIGSEPIDFTVKYSNRKTISISIVPPDSITVSAPKGLREEYIFRAVESKIKWIEQKLNRFKDIKYQRKSKEYVDGEYFMYLGRNYSLKISIDKGVNKPMVMLHQSKFLITSSTEDKEKLKQALEEWYKGKAREKILSRIKYFQGHFNVEPRHIKIKEQKKRWGSCSSNRDLLFNWKIVMAPNEVLDYIVIHEMCHLVHLNHSSSFWNLVESIMPDYKHRQEWLRDNGFLLNI